MIPPDTLSVSEQQNIKYISVTANASQNHFHSGQKKKKKLFRRQRFLYLSVELDSQDGVGVGVVADFSSLLEMADLEFPRGLEADDGHQAARE